MSDCLLVKPDPAIAVREFFYGTGIQLVTDRAKYLGSAVGTDEFINATTHEHANKWMKKLQHLAQIAETKPHVAH